MNSITAKVLRADKAEFERLILEQEKRVLEDQENLGRLRGALAYVANNLMVIDGEAAKALSAKEEARRQAETDETNRSNEVERLRGEAIDAEKTIRAAEERKDFIEKVAHRVVELLGKGE